MAGQSKPSQCFQHQFRQGFAMNHRELFYSNIHHSLGPCPLNLSSQVLSGDSLYKILYMPLLIFSLHFLITADFAIPLTLPLSSNTQKSLYARLHFLRLVIVPDQCKFRLPSSEPQVAQRFPYCCLIFSQSPLDSILWPLKFG